MNTSNSNRIVKNSVLLYARMTIMTIVNLYTVRLVLKTLGVIDYGIFDVVAGIVILFQSVSSVLSLSTQRFYSYALGDKRENGVQIVYSSSIWVFLIFSLIVFFICETLGCWFLNAHLEIPESRLNAANWVFQFSVISFIFVMMTTPFSSAVLANEDMGVFSIISLGECLLKLIFVIILSRLIVDKLVYYGFFLMLISVIGFISYFIIVKTRYSDCFFNRQYTGHWRELLVFAGWTMFGSVAGISITQVCSILINIFFGPIVNAARSIAFQISNSLNSFCSNFLMAVRPPMIKAYAEGDYDYLDIIFIYSTKFIFYGMLIIFIPLFLEMKYILFLWLDTVDSQTVLFSRLMLIYTFILVLGNPITIIMHAGGFVKQYHLLVEIPTLMIMPATYILFKIGCGPVSTYIVMIVAILLSHLVRLACLRHYYAHYSLRNYFYSFVFRSLFVVVISFTPLYLFFINTQEGVLRLLLLCLFSFIILLPSSFYFGLIHSERQVLVSYLKKFFKK